MQLKTRPARPFSATHTVQGCCGELATLIVCAFRGGGELVLAHERYRVSRDGGFVLEGPEGVGATAHAAGGRCFEIAYAGRRLTVEPAPSLRHAYVVSEGVAQRGAVRRRTPFVRGIEAELTAEVPFPVQLVIAWLMPAAPWFVSCLPDLAKGPHFRAFSCLRPMIGSGPMQGSRSAMGEREEWLEKERLALGCWTAVFLGLFSSYGKNDSVDVQYELGGRTMVATGSRSWRPRSEPKRRLARSPQR